MVGLIHRLLFGLVESTAGSGALREIRRRAGIADERIFQMAQTYDDEEWRRLFGATCDVLGLTREQAEEAFAAYFIRDALQRWPGWFAMCSNAREFLERQPKIHNSIAASVQDPAARQAMQDKFSVISSDDELIAHYRSANQLCGLYKAMARHILAHYGTSGTIDEVRCQRNGDPECEIHIRWAKGGAS
ncbi:MAG: heme NO-binding domain-containing protein [Phycisphaerae bacterium]|jgi:hypothetical protein